jgi:hypothetical protein
MPAKYPISYEGPHPIEEQITVLARILNLDPTLALRYAECLPTFPNGAEGWFAIPSLSATANFFPEPSQGESYISCMRFILRRLRASGFTFTENLDHINLEGLGRSARTGKALAMLALKQPGEILVVAAQLGLRHRGCHASELRGKLLGGEFGLGMMEVGSILLTHPDRVADGGLDLCCAGDEVDEKIHLPGEKRYLREASLEYSSRRCLRLSLHRLRSFRQWSGPVTAFLSSGCLYCGCQSCV